MHRLLAATLLVAACASGRAAGDRALAGSWGGRGIALELGASGGTVEYDCAHGTVDGALVADPAGRFAGSGTWVAEHGGPVRRDETPPSVPVRYRGVVHGDAMTLTVVQASDAEEIDTFTLARGAAATLTKCR